MKKSKVIFWVVSIPIWIFTLIVLIKAVTDYSPENSFRKYALIIGIGFISLTGFLRIIYKKLNK